MKAVRVHRYGEAPSVDDVPEPKVSGPLDVLVEIGGAGLCRTDIHILEGQWAEKSGVALPYIIGHENAGWVREVGSAVTNAAPGDAVILHPLITCGLCRSCRAGDDMHCDSGAFPGITTTGGMAEYLVTGARSVRKLDPDLQPADVAALADAGLTAYHAVRRSVPLLHPGTHVAVLGAGGLGHIGVQCLTAMTPAEITVIDTNEAALSLAGELGAHHTVHSAGNAAGPGGVVDRVRDITNGRGADVVLDFVGEKGTETQSVAMLRGAGSYFVIGYGGAVHVPTIDMIFSEINVVGNLVGSYNDLDELMTLAARGKVRLHTTTYPLEAVGDAIHDLETGRLRGRGILVPGGLVPGEY